MKRSKGMFNSGLQKLARVSVMTGVALGITMFGAVDSQAGQYDGVKVKIMTFTGPQIAEPLQRRAPEFKKLTGAEIEVVTVPFSDL